MITDKITSNSVRPPFPLIPNHCLHSKYVYNSAFQILFHNIPTFDNIYGTF